jgi:hypothetical protein
MDVIDWLLDSDPALRWQVLRDLTDAPDSSVIAERARVAHEGWGAALLAAQADDGRWDGGTFRPERIDDSLPFFDVWTATHYALQQLVDLGVDPDDPVVRSAVDRVVANVRWEHEGEPYFDGEVEACFNGVVLTSASYFGVDSGTLVATVRADQLPDGGWNCYSQYGARTSSFHSTICVVEGLLAAEQAAGSAPELASARAAGEEYLLERNLFRRRSDGSIPDPRMTMLSYPVRWYHDVLRGLEHFRRANRRDDRLAEAVALLRSKARPDGRWTLENTHQGQTLLALDDGEGWPSTWVTLRALRVLRWWDGEGRQPTVPHERS